VEEQLPLALGLVVVAVALLERRDVGADQPRLVALDPRVGVRQVDLAGADRLDLGAGQDEAGLDDLLDRELVSRSPIERDGLLGNVRAPSGGNGESGSHAEGDCVRHSQRESRPIGPAFISYPTHRVSD
jgi:hypothetical protein